MKHQNLNRSSSSSSSSSSIFVKPIVVKREIIESAASSLHIENLDPISISFCVRSTYPYAFLSKQSEIRWRQRKPLRKIDCTLGFPILVVDEDGEYVEPTEDEEDCSDAFGNDKEVRESVRSYETRKICNKISHLHDVGVFACERFKPGSYIGLYGGTVMTDEEWERDKPDGQYVFVIHHGRQGVVVDGEIGPTNELKHINHSCEPNARMIELFENGSWYVVVVAIQDIEIGDEITHDYGLTTEDPDDPNLLIQCRCETKSCRGTLFQYREW
jgi:hypothetical protein